MAKTKTEKRSRDKTIATSSYFLGCFGFSRKIYSDKPMKDDGGEKKTKKKKRFRSLLSKLRMKNGEIKPSPIEDTKKKTLISSVEDKTDEKQKVLPVIRRLTDRKNIPVDDKSMNHVTTETKQELGEINTDRSKVMERLVSFKDDTCTKRISTSSQPEMKPYRGKNGSRVDPVIGISIIILTLVIMLIWGRLCAILCTSAWCYFLPRLREAAALAKRKRSAFVPDLMKSESCNKKKVVLNGFLGRQNRVSLL